MEGTETELHRAAREGQVERVRTLSSLHPDWLTALEPERYGMPLHEAAAAGHAECVRALLEAGAPVDARTAHTDTALMLASGCGRVECVRALLAAGADVLAEDYSGNNALHSAASRHAVLTVLLDAARESGLLPAAVQARSETGYTPFLAAARVGSTACMAALLACGSDVDALIAAGSNMLCGGKATALHLTLWREGHTEAVQLLAALAPQLATVRAGCGWTPLHTARKLNRYAVVLEQLPMPMAAALPVLSNMGAPALPLFAQLLASRWPLTPEEWELVPAPCPGLGPLLPRAVQESDEQAALLVRHLSHADRQRLRAAALSLALGRDGQQEPLPRLPLDAARHVLALSLA